MTEAQRRAHVAYQRRSYVQIAVKLNKNTDADIIEKLDSVPSKLAYIKACIRKDMKEAGR